MSRKHRRSNPLIEAAIVAAGGNQQHLATKLGCRQQTVSKLLHGEIEISADWAVRIDRATAGRVPAEKLYPTLAAILDRAATRAA